MEAAPSRPVRTKRPADGQIVMPAGASTKRRGRSANVSYQQIHQVPAAVVGMDTEAAARSASRICWAKKRRRTPSSPPRPRAKKKKLLRSNPLRLDPRPIRGVKQASSTEPARSSSSTDHPCPPDPDNNNSRRDCASNLILLDDDVDFALASARTDLVSCPPDNYWTNKGCANLLDDDDAPAGKPRVLDDAPAAKPRVLASDVRHPPCPPDPDNNTNWRDWANMADGPAGLIADRVLAYDVADYVRYRAVCRPWRHSSTEPRTHSGLDRRFHPWRWTMLREELAVPDRCRFLNTSTGECVKVDIPELHEYEMLAVTPEGLLVLARKPPCATTICLLNPLTRNLIHLPPLSTLVPPEYHEHMLPELDALSLKSDFEAWGSGIANDDSTVVICFHNLSMLGMAKPGDDHWRLLEYHGGVLTAAPIMFEGHFYCVTSSGVMVLETETPRFEVAAKLNMRAHVMADSFHFVNNCGELMLVHSRLRRRNMPGRFYDTYRVDLDTGTLIPVKSLGSAGRALFLGQLRSLSVSLEVFPSSSISANTIYLSFDMQERMQSEVEAYHLADASVEPPNSFVPQPHTLADCLSLANTIR